MRTLSLVIAIALSLNACVRSNQLSRLSPVPGDHPLYPYQELQYLSCNIDSIYPDDPEASTVLDLDSLHLDAASRAWPYALMSSNVYLDAEDSPPYLIPDWQVASRWESPSGLALEEWHHRTSGDVDGIAVIFKGTDFTSLADWRTNLAVIEPRQHREAFAYMQGAMSRARAEQAHVVVAGHSLGGAIALNMSLRIPGVEMFGFNPSPRAFYDVGHVPEARRTLMYESGEILSFLRWPWWHRLNDFERFRYNFLAFIRFRSLASVQEHSMYLFSRGLLLAAIKAKNAEAGRAFTANFQHLNLAAELDNSQHDIEACEKIFNGFPVR
jgi:hypothetical protein